MRILNHVLSVLLALILLMFIFRCAMTLLKILARLRNVFANQVFFTPLAI